jgi:hypothetical protein
MERKTKSYVGMRPVFTGSPSVEVGGFNVDTEEQSFIKGDIIPAGTLCKVDDFNRKAVICKTGKVKSVDSTAVTLESDDFINPNFAVGDKVAKAEGGVYSSAITITAISNTDSGYVVTLSGTISGLAQGDILCEVVSEDSDVVTSGIITADNTNKVYMVQPGLDLAADDKVLKGAVTSESLIASAVAVETYDKASGKLVLAASISGAAGDTITKVFADDTKAVATQKVGKFVKGNALVVNDVPVPDNAELIVDVTMDTMQYACYSRRVLPVPTAQLSDDGLFLLANKNIRFTQMY